ncbi:polyhydroxyalkanoate granule-associated phasin [Hydrogenophaga sp.]|uniref:polyhydroxyalkanoate granule-associated phasin n=1 Tax=Hydrogenophaga sp. TaxID=1904254 RepID=UPI003567E6E0
MPSRSTRSSASLAELAAELAVAVPQVVMHRLTRMAQAGVQPSARDRKEFQLMNDEKSVAFHESWAAMASQASSAQQQWLQSMMQVVWQPWFPMGATDSLAPLQVADVAMDIARQGLLPVHRQAVSNARRLNRIGLK